MTIAVLWIAATAARLIVGAHIADDAYITMRYSRNVISTGMLAYNPPDAVLGTSTPLWTAVLAAGTLTGAAPERTAIFASGLADLGSILLLLTSPAGTSLAAVAAAATIAAWPAYVAYAVSGMETSLYVLTIVATMVALSGRRWAAAGVAASLAALCRPDGALVIVLGSVWAWVAGPRAASLRFTAIAALICAPWAAFALVHFGSLVPASVSAKAAAADPWHVSVQNVFAYFSHGVYAVLTALALAGFVAIAKRREATGPLLLLWSIWAWCYVLTMTAANGFTHFPWYFVPLLPIYTAAAAAAVEWVLAPERGSVGIRNGSLPPEGGRSRTSARGVHGRAVVLPLALSAVLLSRMPALERSLDGNAEGRERLYASVAAELARVNPACTVAATEIGTIGYHYPGRILDLVGLVSPEVAGRPLQRVLAESDARWLVTYDTHFDRRVAADSRFTDLYARRRTVPVAEARALEIYERRATGACSNH